MADKLRTYRFGLLATVTVQAANKRIALGELPKLTARLKTISSQGFSPVRGAVLTEIESVEQHPNPRQVSHAKIAKEDIRITGVFDVANILATGVLTESGEPFTFSFVRMLTYIRTLPDVHLRQPAAAKFVYDKFMPLATHLDRTTKMAEAKAQGSGEPTLEDAAVFEVALKTFADPRFAVFVQVETPVRMYRPDGEYDSGWGFTRTVYGFGLDYESALRDAYQTVILLRAEQLI